MGLSRIPPAVADRVRAAARNRCGYCQSPQRLVMARSEDGLRIVGLTPVGRATVEALHLSNDPDALEV
jgi:hypothetical protein